VGLLITSLTSEIVNLILILAMNRMLPNYFDSKKISYTNMKGGVDNMTFKSSQKGFTLIELLIVIIIIGILAGVLIAVINPTAQQNRARDAVVRSAINKIALSTNSYISAYGRIPDEVEFLGGIEATGFGADCATATTADCRFEVNNSPLSAFCATLNYYGTGTTQCYYRYAGTDNASPVAAGAWTATTTDYRLVARAYGSPNLFMYKSLDSKMYLCGATGLNCAAL